MSEGLRQRKKASAQSASPAAEETRQGHGQRTEEDDAPQAHEDAAPVSQRSEASTQPDEHDSDDEDAAPERYGYDGSEGEEEAGDDSDDSDDPYQAHTTPWTPPPGMLDPPDNDDCVYLTAGGLGFLVCAVTAALLVPLGVESDYVMAAGMVILSVFVMALSFLPARCTRGCTRPGSSKLSPVESITPQMVFVVAGCVGVMIGGLFGGVFRYVKLF